MPTPPVNEITPRELIQEILAGKDYLLLDCREPYERQQFHLEGSLHIPMDEIPNRLDELDPEAEIVVMCAHGIRSHAVARYLASQGYRARSLTGGLASWPTE